MKSHVFTFIFCLTYIFVIFIDPKISFDIIGRIVLLYLGNVLYFEEIEQMITRAKKFQVFFLEQNKQNKQFYRHACVVGRRLFLSGSSESQEPRIQNKCSLEVFVRPPQVVQFLLPRKIIFRSRGGVCVNVPEANKKNLT